MKIVIPDDYQNVVRKLDCFNLLAGHDVVVYHDTVHDIDSQAMRFAEADALVLIRERTDVGAGLLARLPNLKLISQTGRVASHLDIAACARNGVTVLEGQGSPIAPAELAWALIMNALRQIPQAITDMKQGKWQTNVGQSVAGKTIGIWGYGKIGKRMARFADAFDAKVIVWGSEISRRAAEQDGYQSAESKTAFFSNADVITLHLRLVPATVGIISADDLAQMKPASIFVNTARAELLENGCLLKALAEGRPGFVALDVFETEPIYDSEHPLLLHPKVICTPHLGYVERNSYELYFGQAFQNVIEFFEQ